MRTKRMAVSLAVVLVLAGCGGAASPARTPGASAAPVDSVQPSLTLAPSASATPGITELAPTYLALALKGDVAIAACDAARVAAAQDVSVSKLTRAKAAAQACLAVYDSYVAGLQGTTWGAVQPQADAVVAAMATIHSLLAEMANAATGTAFLAAYDKMTAANNALHTAADAMRAALGLPPA